MRRLDVRPTISRPRLPKAFQIGTMVFALLVVGLSAWRAWPTWDAPLPVARPLYAEPPLTPHELRLRLVREEAKRAGVPVPIALAVSLTENWSGDTLAVSSAGALGIMQVMPTIWAEAFIDECGDAPLTNPRRNACVGVRVLKQYHERYHNWNLALRAYNGALRYSRAGDQYIVSVMMRLQFVE